MPFECLQSDVRGVLLRSAGVASTGSLSVTCSGWRDAARDPFLWYALYDTTQREKKDAAPLRALIDRPFGAAAVGWSVQVLQSGTGSVEWRPGVIEAYDESRDRFSVRYA